MACGFFESALFNSVGALLVDWVVKPVGRQFNYVHSFHNYVEKLTEEKGELAAERDRLQHEIEEAQRQFQGIEGGVLNLLLKVENVLTDMESLENEMFFHNKKCFNLCPNWWWRYRLSKKLAKKTLVISGLLEKTAKFGQPRRVGYHDASTFPTTEFWPSKDFMLSKSSKVAFNQIIEALKDDNVSMIGLWGMGGVGKTTLVREVASQAKRLNLFDKVVIVTVSQKPSFERIRDEIAKGLWIFNIERGKSKQELWSMLLKEKRFFIILDDVWATINLKEEIGIPVGEDHKGCKMLLTTRRRQVCLSMDCQTEVKLGCLDEDEAWALFEKKAGLGNCFDDVIRKVAKEVAERCEGLPIAIVTLGSALKGKTPAQWIVASRRLNNHRLMEIEDIDQEHGNKNAYLCIEMSFDYLRNMETKICFLLCSLFPEDYKISVEDLVRYAWGLQLYRDTDTIEEVRSEVHAAIEILKDSCLLLDCGDELVKMHDVVRGFALQVACNKMEISFMILFDEFEKWPRDESFVHHTAMSLKVNRINELPQGLLCPNLKILLLGVGEESEDVYRSISCAFFEGMKGLKVCAVPHGFYFPHVFQSLTSLRTLNLRSDPHNSWEWEPHWMRRYELGDISPLGKLKELQILNLEGSSISELPSEIGGLSDLRLLDLSNCLYLRRITPNLIRRLSKLEELYLGNGTFIEWATIETGEEEEESNASLLELNSLPNLATMSLEICPEHLPKDFVFPKLKRYNVSILGRPTPFYSKRFFPSRSLKVDPSSLDACRELFGGVESLVLKSFAGYTNLVPSLVLDQKGSNKLISLILENCKDIKCLIDTTIQQEPTMAFSNLKELRLHGIHSLKELCKGHDRPQGFLQNLNTFSMQHCNGIFSGIPILQNLERLRVGNCDQMHVLFQYTPELKSNLRNLKDVSIRGCNKLTYLFPTSVAKSLCQLEILQISHLVGLEEIIQSTEESNVCLRSLREVTVHECHHLTSLCSLSHGQILENLRRLVITGCSKLEYIFPISMAERLPQLNVVRLVDLPQLKGINGREIVFTLPSLEELDVTNICSTSFIISAKIKELWLTKMLESQQWHNLEHPELSRRSPNMEYLRISNFEELFDGQYNLSSLEKLLLYELPELRVVWKGPIQVVNFQNLTDLEVHHCGRLRYIFSTTIAQKFPQLSSLWISHCNELEQIIENDHSLQPVCFPNLTRIEIEKCKNLKSLLPVSVAAGLSKLKELYVGVSDLEQVFEQGDEANVSRYEEKVVQLHQLGTLYLGELQSLVSFIPVGYHFVLPSLGCLQVEDCPKLATSFSVDSKQFGHAITKPAALCVDQHIEEGSASAQETTWAIGSNIEWFGRCWS